MAFSTRLTRNKVVEISTPDGKVMRVFMYDNHHKAMIAFDGDRDYFDLKIVREDNPRPSRQPTENQEAEG